jgi:hypothetical protein
LKLQQHREQTAHLQAALLHSLVRAQIRTAQQDSIPFSSSLDGATAALSSSPAAGLTCVMHLRTHVCEEQIQLAFGRQVLLQAMAADAASGMIDS